MGDWYSVNGSIKTKKHRQDIVKVIGEFPINYDNSSEENAALKEYEQAKRLDDKWQYKYLWCDFWHVDIKRLDSSQSALVFNFRGEGGYKWAIEWFNKMVLALASYDAIVTYGFDWENPTELKLMKLSNEEQLL